MASNKKAKPRRRYELKERARRQEETRIRITEAAVELHGTVGPANTTISEIAKRAGVRRMTVYNHFATDSDLFDACSGHWFRQNPPPDPSRWGSIEDPRERVGRALSEIYAYYRRNEGMLGNVMRDAPLISALESIMTQKWGPVVAAMVDILAESWPGNGATDIDRRATLGLVLDFSTWRILTRSGLGDEEAAQLGVRLVAGVGA